jgi:hypothetical protein
MVNARAIIALDQRFQGSNHMRGLRIEVFSAETSEIDMIGFMESVV